MKCVCGYYHLKKYQIEDLDDAFKEEAVKNNGEKEFIALNVTCTREGEYYSVRPIYLYACPKCGTIRMED